MNDNETVEQVFYSVEAKCYDKEKRSFFSVSDVREIDRRFVSAHKCEMAAKDSEVEKLRALVKELADDLENNQCQGCHNIGCSSCSRSHDIRALVAKARKAAGEEAAR